MATLPSNITLKGSTITLKQPVPEDDKEMSQILSDPKTMAYLRNLLPRESGWTEADYAARRTRYDKLQEAQAGFMLHVFDNGSGALLGMAGLRQTDFNYKNAEFGIILHHPCWRRGVSTCAALVVLEYAFETLKLHRIFARTKPLNTAMRGFFEKFGFTLESIEKESVLAFGTFEDSCVYVLLEDKWPKTKADLLEKLNSYSK